MRHYPTHEDSQSPDPDECPFQQEMIDQLQASLLEEANGARNLNGRANDEESSLTSDRDELLTELEQLSWRRYFSTTRRH